MLRRFRALFALLVCFLCSAAVRADLASIELTVDGRSQVQLRADGRSQAIVRATIRDSRGRVVADGTRVLFSLVGTGRLDASVVSTTNGVAQATLTAPDQPGQATIVANLETPGQAIPARLAVLYSAAGDVTDAGPAWARLSGASVAYIPGAGGPGGLFHAAGKEGGAVLAFRDLTVQASRLQVNASLTALRADGKVVLTRGKIRRLYDRLLFDVVNLRGVGERVEEYRPDQFTVSGADLAETLRAPEERIPGARWAFISLPDRGLSIACQAAAIKPDQVVQLRRATFYIDGQKAFSLPYHVFQVGQKTLFREQILGVGPAGMTVDFPLYYDVRPTGVGTLYLRRGAQFGSSIYSIRPGWSLDLNHAYNGRSGAEGVFQVLGMTRRDWGLRFQHGQRFGERTAGTLYLDFPNHRNLFFNSQLSRDFEGFRVTATGNGSRSPAVRDAVTGQEGTTAGDLLGQIYIETRSRPLARPAAASPFQYTLNAAVTQQSFFGASTVAQGTFRTRTVGTRLFSRPIPVGRGVSLTQSANLGQTWVHGGGGNRLQRSGASILGTTALYQRLGRPGGELGGLRLSYDYTQTPQISFAGATAVSANGRHRLGAGLDLSGGDRWSLFVSGSRGLDTRLSSVDGSLEMGLGGLWRVRTRLSDTAAGSFRYREIEYSLIRLIEGREVAIYYSTIYRRFQLNLTGLNL